MKYRRYLPGGTMLAALIAVGLKDPAVRTQTPGAGQGPKYRFDPGWPKAFPQVATSSPVAPARMTLCRLLRPVARGWSRLHTGPSDRRHAGQLRLSGT